MSVQGVYKLIGKESCATAFAISESELLTNAHVTQKNCDGNVCPGLSLLQNGQALSFSQAFVEAEINAFDLAIIRLTGAPALSTMTLSPRPPEVGQALFVSGFPKCGHLTTTTGKVTTMNSFQFFSNAQIKHGNSGGPVQSEDGLVYGIVSQISDPLTGFLSSATRISGDSKIIRGDLARSILGQAPSDRLELSASYALRFIKNDLSKLGGLRRLLGGIDLTNIIQGMILDATRFGPPPAALSWTLLEQDDLRNFPITGNSATVQELAALSFLELRGTSFTNLAKNLDSLIKALPGSNPSELRDVAKRLSINYLGLLPTTIAYLGAAILLLIIWTGASCGFVLFGQATFWTRVRRAIIALATPLVLLAAILIL